MSDDPDLKRHLKVDKISVGHNFGEMYIRFGDEVFVLSPGAAKRLTLELGSAVEKYEHENGTIQPPTPPHNISLPKRILRALYRESHPTSKLTSINTSKRKKR